MVNFVKIHKPKILNYQCFAEDMGRQDFEELLNSVYLEIVSEGKIALTQEGVAFLKHSIATRIRPIKIITSELTREYLERGIAPLEFLQLSRKEVSDIKTTIKSYEDSISLWEDRLSLIKKQEIDKYMDKVFDVDENGHSKNKRLSPVDYNENNKYVLLIKQIKGLKNKLSEINSMYFF